MFSPICSKRKKKKTVVEWKNVFGVDGPLEDFFHKKKKKQQVFLLQQV